MKKLIAAFFLLASVAHAQVPPAVDPLSGTFMATSSETGNRQVLATYHKTVVSPTSTSIADFRSFRGDTLIATDQDVTKADSVSGYVYHDGSGSLTQGFGGSLQYFMRGAGLCGWCEGGMAASRNQGTGRISNAIGLLATAENKRAGSAIGINNGYGIFAMAENYGRMEFGKAGQFSIRNYAGGDYDNAAGVFISVENEANIDFLYGLRIDTNNTGTIGNYRVIFLRAPTGVTPQYALYSEVNAPSYFAGDVRAAGSSQGLQAQVSALQAQVTALAARVTALEAN